MRILPWIARGLSARSRTKTVASDRGAPIGRQGFHPLFDACGVDTGGKSAFQGRLSLRRPMSRGIVDLCADAAAGPALCPQMLTQTARPDENSVSCRAARPSRPGGCMTPGSAVSHRWSPSDRQGRLSLCQHQRRGDPARHSEKAWRGLARVGAFRNISTGCRNDRLSSLVDETILPL